MGAVAEKSELNLDEGDLPKGGAPAPGAGGPRIGRLLEAIQSLDGVTREALVG